MLFQHTAARRRLGIKPSADKLLRIVSTHSRPKAAGNAHATLCYDGQFQHTAARRRLVTLVARRGALNTRFNTQPPEGGWGLDCQVERNEYSFNTQPPEGGWLWFIMTVFY